MKKLLIGLLLVTSASSFAVTIDFDCEFNAEEKGIIVGTHTVQSVLTIEGNQVASSTSIFAGFDEFVSLKLKNTKESDDSIFEISRVKKEKVLSAISLKALSGQKREMKYEFKISSKKRVYGKCFLKSI